MESQPTDPPTAPTPPAGATTTTTAAADSDSDDSAPSPSLRRYFSTSPPSSAVTTRQTSSPTSTRPPSHPSLSPSRPATATPAAKPALPASTLMYISACHLPHPHLPKYVIIYAASSARPPRTLRPPSHSRSLPYSSSSVGERVVVDTSQRSTDRATIHRYHQRLPSSQSLQTVSSVATAPTIPSSPTRRASLPPGHAPGGVGVGDATSSTSSAIRRRAPRAGRTEALVDRSDRDLLEWASPIPLPDLAAKLHVCVYVVRRQPRRHRDNRRDPPPPHELVAHATVDSRRVHAAMDARYVLEIPVTAAAAFDDLGKRVSVKLHPNAVIRVSPLVHVRAKVTAPQQTAEKCPSAKMSIAADLARSSVSTVSSGGGAGQEGSSRAVATPAGRGDAAEMAAPSAACAEEPRKITLGLSADYIERSRSFGRKDSVDRTFYTLHVAVGACESVDQQDLGSAALDAALAHDGSGGERSGGERLSNARRSSVSRSNRKSKLRKSRALPVADQSNVETSSAKSDGDTGLDVDSDRAAAAVSNSNEKTNWTLVYRSRTVQRIHQKSMGGTMDLQYMSNKPLISVPGATLTDADIGTPEPSALDRLGRRLGFAPDRTQQFSLPNATFCASSPDQLIKLSLYEDLRREGRQKLIAYTIFTLSQLRGELGHTMPFVVKEKKKRPARQVGKAKLTHVEHCPDPHYFALRARLHELK